MSQHKRTSPRKAAKAIAASPVSGASSPDAVGLLGVASDALNALERAGIAVQLAHGAVITEYGYVFRVGPDGAPWAVRTRALTEFPVTGEDD